MTNEQKFGPFGFMVAQTLKAVLILLDNGKIDSAKHLLSGLLENK